MPYIGEIAALGAAISWSMWALISTSASRRIGSFAMNCYRMLFGVALIYSAWIATRHSLLLSGISSENWTLLGMSGLFGFFFADICLFQCYVDLGPRLGVLLFNTYPLIGAVIAWVFLKEILSPLAVAGILITVAGIVWVATERRDRDHAVRHPHFKRGIFLALIASLFQSISFAVAKPAMTGAGGVDPLAATLIRAIFGGLMFWFVAVFSGKINRIIASASDKKAIGLIGGGAFLGPAFGVWLSMVAIRHAPIGIASAIMAMMPVTIIPMTALVYKERITWRAFLGAAIACAGVAILFNS
jgi:drug/metabolite transporter (DMT)-like permease